MENNIIAMKPEPRSDTAQSSEVASLSELVQKFETSEELTYDARRLMDRDVDYYDNKQLTDKQHKALTDRGQPPTVFNKIKPNIDYSAGMEKQQRVDPKASARNPQDEQAAYAATQALMFVTDKENYNRTRSLVWKNMLKAGVGGVKVDVETVRGQPEVRLRTFSYDRFFYDPHSSDLDFLDANYMGVVVWEDRDVAISTYGEEHRDKFQSSINEASLDQHYDDKPKWATWGDAKRNRVRIVEMAYMHDGKWHEAIYTKGGVIVNRVSPYVDEYGESENPFIAQTAYIDRDNNRYGAIRELVDPQDDYNKRRSKATHLLNTRQVVADKGAVDDANQIRNELARPDAFIEKNTGFEFNIQANQGLETGQFQLMQEAASDLRSKNIQTQMVGGNSQSGRAKQSQQQAASVEMTDLFDNLRDFDIRVFRAIWSRVKQTWKAPRWLQVTDDPHSKEYIGVNVPLTDPFGQVVDIQNPIAQMDVDIIIEEAPDVETLAEEENARWTQELPIFAQLGVPNDILLQISLERMPHSRTKASLTKKITDWQEAQKQQAPDPMQQQAVQLELADKAAKIDETQSKTVLNEARVAEIQTNNRVVPFKAVNDARMAQDGANQQGGF